MRLRKQIKGLAGNNFLKSAAIIASGTGLGQIIIVLASPALTRIYTPEQFGALAIFSSLVGVIAIISSLRYELAIPLPRSKINGKCLLAISLVLNCVIALLVLLLISWLRVPLSQWIGMPEMLICAWFIPVGVLLLGIYKTLNFWAVREKSFKRIARSKISQNIANVSTQLITGFVGAGALGLIAGQLIGYIIGIASLLKGVVLMQGDWYGKNYFIKIHLLLRKYINFPKYDAPAAFINTLSNELPQLLFAALFNPAVAGFYLLAQRVLGAPLALVSQAVGQVLYGNAANNIRSGKLGALVLRLIVYLSALVALPCSLIAFFGADVFSTLFGDNWYEAGQYASILILNIAAQFVYSPISLVLLATEGQHINLSIHISMLILRAIGIYWGWLLNDPFLAVLGFSLAGVFVYMIGVIVILYRAKNYHTSKLANIKV